MTTRLLLDPAGDHWLGPDHALGTRAPRSRLVAAFREHVRVVDGEARLGEVVLGRWRDGWEPATKLTALEVRFLADRGYPHPAGAVIAAAPPRTDLHTHFAGCLRPDALLEIGAKHDLRYPAALLGELGIEVAEDLRLASVPANVREALGRALALAIDTQHTHQDMSRIYKLRRPITKHLAAFPDLCRQVALDYAAMGVVYAELSVYDVFEPAVLRLAHEHLPHIRAETGVDLRFLAALGRKDEVEWVLDMVDRLRGYAGSPLLAGVDFMGHETTSTHELVPQLRAVAAVARELRPDWVIRVHAGENPGHPENVRVAVDTLLAEGVRMRIGHGLYGVDDETLARMAEAGVVIEFNLDSNFALNNIRDALGVPLARYVAAHAPIVLGTDGYGIYHADALGQLRAAQLTGLADPSIVARTEAAILDARREADARLTARPFTVLEAPPPKHYTPALAARRKAEQQAASRVVREALAARAIPLIDPGALAARYPDRTFVSIAGAWRKRWLALDDAGRAAITALIDQLVAGLASTAVLLTGGTRHGVEGAVHAAARRHGAIVVGALVEASPIADLDAIAAATLVGRTLYDKSCGLYRLIADVGGSAVFLDGGNIVHDEIRTATNLRLRRVFLAGDPAGASSVAATRWPAHAFTTAADALARLAGEQVHRTRRGGSYYFTGPNPTVDAVCLRAVRGQREVLLVRRRADVGAEGGRWALPGGFVHTSARRGESWQAGAETFEAAVLRELAEETGLDLVGVAPRSVGVYEGGGRDPRDTAEAWSRSHAFVVELPPHLAAQTLLAGDDASEARWHRLDALPPLAFDHATLVANACELLR